MIARFVPIDKEQPDISLWNEEHDLPEVPFPGEEAVLDGDVEVRVIRRLFWVKTGDYKVILFVRVLDGAYTEGSLQ